MEGNVAYCLLTEDVELSSFHEATKSQEASLWMVAMQEEICHPLLQLTIFIPILLQLTIFLLLSLVLRYPIPCAHVPTSHMLLGSRYLDPKTYM